ncbi:MAG: hypothetical protein ACRDTE_26385 [Pseudonocardiaceae bacterium]
MMFDAMNSAEIDAQRVELLPARTVLSSGGRFDLAVDGIEGADGRGVDGHAADGADGAHGD